jgi:hypothetical protein
MGNLDSLLKEKQVIKQNASYVYPDQVNSGIIAEGSAGIDSVDIADASIDEDKIAAAAVDTTKAMSGGHGTILAVVPDGTVVEFDGGAAGAKKVRVADAQIAAAHLGAIAGNGLTGGAGAALAVNCSAAGGLEISGGNKLQVKAASVTLAKLATNAKIRRISIPLVPASAGATISTQLFICPIGKSYTIVEVSIASYLPVLDANGTVIGNLNRGLATPNIVEAFDMESLVAKVAQHPTIITTGNRHILTAGEQIYWETVSGDEGMDGLDNADAGSVLTISLIEN